MRGVSKTLIVALAVLLLVVGLAACGGGDSGSGSTEAAASGQAEGKENGVGEESDGHSDDSSDAASGDEAGDFVPKDHNDSGGGSQQFKVKGGDNSVQEFGTEAETSELDAAAATLHNFLDARAQGDWAATCSYMAKSVVEAFEKLAAHAKQIEDKSCEGILEKLTSPVAGQAMEEEAARADVASLRVEGERAFIIYTGADGAVLAMPMTNEDGDWKVASLAGTPLS